MLQYEDSRVVCTEGFSSSPYCLKICNKYTYSVFYETWNGEGTTDSVLGPEGAKIFDELTQEVIVGEFAIF